MRFTFRQQQRLFLLAVTSLIVILLLVIFQRAQPVMAVANGLRVALTAIGTGVATTVEHIFYSKTELIKINDQLQKEIEYLALNQSEVQELRDQIAALSALIGFEQRSSMTINAASVMVRSNDLNGEAILLDRGERDGVNVGDAVVADDGFLVAVIQTVRPSSSIARLVTDQMSNIGVRVLNTESTIGIAEGQNGELLRVDFIPQSVDLTVNDVIVTSGLDAGIPQGLVLGIISDVIRDEHNPFQQALVQPLIDLRRLTVVGILQTPSL